MNHVVLIGRLASEVDLKQTQSGLAVCAYTIAINNGKDKSGNERPAEFITCKAWQQTAEFIAKYFSKGKMIAIEGKFKTDKYQHKQYNDVTIYSSYVLINNVEFCGDKGQQAPAQQIVKKAQAAGVAVPEDFIELINDEEMPF